MSDIRAELHASPEFQALVKAWLKDAPRVKPFLVGKNPDEQTYAYAHDSGFRKGACALAAYLTGVEQE